ncbi:hypothetical protein KR084_007096 [Drosophila pseudotakahashii]|nr:hypothetical protein KR084_007096 [Drosophila pseudotakahashii]
MAPEDITSHLNMERLKKTQKLIRLYRSNECLWNPQSPGYHSSSVKDDAWRRITLGMKSGLTPDQVKLQVLGLRNYYSRECSAIQQSHREGYSYVPRHSYFEDLHFLGNLESQEANQVTNYSEATFFSPLASLSPCCSVAKDGFTFYKMILEPEPPNEELLRKYQERSTSGNDRWYPTTYCVKCEQDTEEEDPCDTCEGRGRSSFGGNQCDCCTPGTTDQHYHQDKSPAHRTQSQDDPKIRQKRKGNPNRTQDQCPCHDQCPCSPAHSRKRTPQTHQNGIFVDMSTWDGDESTNNGEHNDKWPGPRLCSQRRQEWKPRYRKVIPDNDLKSGCGSWKRNNEAICQRLRDQLARQENQSGRYSEEGNSGQSRTCECKNDRRQSGEDQKKSQRNRNSQNGAPYAPTDPAQYSNNQPISDQAYYNTTQPVQNQCFCNTNQSNLDPQRCSTYGCQCMYCNRTVVSPQGNYYQTQQIEPNSANYSRAAPPDNQVGQAQPYGESNYVNDYGPPAYPEQQHVYCINTEDPEMWLKPTTAAEAPNPAQRSWQQEMSGRPPQPTSGSQGLDNINSSTVNKILQQDQAVQHPTAKRRPQPPPRDIQYVECPAYKSEHRSSDQRERLNRRNYQNQEKSNYTEMDSVGSRETSIVYVECPARRPIRNDIDESRSRRRERNQDPHRPSPVGNLCNDAKCPANRRKQNYERPSQRRSHNDDRVVSNPNSNYEDSLSRRGGDLNNSPNKSKVFQLQTDDSQYIECPAHNRRNPQECPNLKRRQNDPSRQNHEERIAQRTRPPSRNRDFDDEKPSFKRRSQDSDRNSLENGDNEQQRPSPRERSSRQGREDNSRSKRNPDEDTNGSSRQDRERSERHTRNSRELGNKRNSNGRNRSSKRNETECNDYTCAYINSLEENAFHKEGSQRQRQSYPKNQADEEKIARRRYRSESLARNQPRESNGYENSEKNKKEVGNFGRSRKQASADIDNGECDSDDDEYEPRKYVNDYRGYNKDLEDRAPTDRSKKYPRKEERTTNERSQRRYRKDDMDSDEYEESNAYNTYPMRDREETSRRIRRPSSYDDSESEDREYIKSTSKNNNGKRNEDNYAPNKKPSYTRGTDVYESEYDCLCSDCEIPKTEDRNMNSMQNRSNRTGRSDQRPSDNIKDEKQERSLGNDYPEYETRNRAPETSSSNRGRKDNQDPEDPDRDVRGKSNEVVGCEYSKYERSSPNQKGNGNIVSDDDCACDPPCDLNEPKITEVKERNQAGSICMALNALAESRNHKKESIGMAKKPAGQTNFLTKLKMERKEARNKPESTNDSQSPTGKKTTRPKTGIHARVQSRSASPQRTQPGGEPTKRRTSTRTGGQSNSHSAAKRTTDTHAAANSKLPFDLNTAAYFICKLQDEGNNHQYLLVVPKKPIGSPDGGQRMGPGQESVKQLHCQRQCSGFQSVSWVDSSSHQSRSQPSQTGGGLSVLGSFRVPPVLASTALGILKEHLNRSVMDRNLDDREAVPPPRRIRRSLLSRATSSRPRRPVLRPSHKANAPMLVENRTLLLTNNPFKDLSFGDNKREVIVLHPPVPGFRPSKNSFGTNDVEVQHITVPNPMPPKPPTKPKRTYSR